MLDGYGRPRCQFCGRRLKEHPVEEFYRDAFDRVCVDLRCPRCGWGNGDRFTDGCEWFEAAGDDRCESNGELWD